VLFTLDDFFLVFLYRYSHNPFSGGPMRIAAGIATLSFAFLIGCGGEKTMVKNEGDLPDFVLNPPVEAGYIFGTGIATQSSPQLAKETADLRAKKEIAKVLGQKVSNLMKDFMGQAGVGEEAEVTEFVQSVTKSITDVELVGAQIVKREFKGGKMYSLAKYPVDAKARDMIKGEVKKQLSSDEALLSAFRAKQGFENLDKELEKLQ
jgi:hypothetical protein